MLFTCPSRYSSTIGHTGVFRLGGWSPRLHARLLGSGVTQEHHYAPHLGVAYRPLTVSRAPFQGTSASVAVRVRGSYNPGRPKTAGLGVGPVRSPLLGASQLIPLPPGTEMFQFPGFASPQRVMTVNDDGRVSPFGHLGLTGCVRLPRAFRSLPRPSSPPCAQASPTCLRSLDHITVSSRARAIYNE